MTGQILFTKASWIPIFSGKTNQELTDILYQHNHALLPSSVDYAITACYTRSHPDIDASLCDSSSNPVNVTP